MSCSRAIYLLSCSDISHSASPRANIIALTQYGPSQPGDINYILYSVHCTTCSCDAFVVEKCSAQSLLCRWR
ncbi:unnamed protein product [Chondrus crispus]|uniref:Uncharacterized protein n=1 Tax=Chondrus crispus TaxID=2769 RepID=S0F352_CHOCR|nr:unnamed protein product [Chondrus crispus]CDF77402.1 unnamed protein product [Chondrus crispus]|eukprot:XP_005712276.1 unnamed protein product [Chondrus crispus]